MLHPASSAHTRPPVFLFSAPADRRRRRRHRRSPPPPLVARLAILDALRRSRERDSCREIELNLEMNIESNELSTSQPASQPVTTLEPPPQPSLSRRRGRETVYLRPLSPFAYWYDRLVSP